MRLFKISESKNRASKLIAISLSVLMAVTLVPAPALAVIPAWAADQGAAIESAEADDALTASSGNVDGPLVGTSIDFENQDEDLLASSITSLNQALSASATGDVLIGTRYMERSWNGTQVVTQEKTENAALVPTNGAMTSGWYYLDKNITVNGRISISGNTNLILGDGNTLNVKGFYVPKGSTLTIYGQSAGTGRIYSHPSGGAAIGAYAGHKGGNIVIHGGKIEAYGHDHCAGIGSNDDDWKDVGSITIYGGDITAKGGNSGAGIGGGRASEGGDITIYGGKVDATGGHYGAGIGGGNGQDKNPMRGAHGGTITIWGGDITAKGGDDGAGIGGGEGGNAGTITINGGTVNATGGNNSAGIGTGEGESTGTGGTVTINGGDVKAWGGGDAAGIGGGEGAHCDTVTINDGTVKATGGGNGAGIGAGRDANGGTIRIAGGDVTAEGKDSSAGIGGGDASGSFADYSSIEISGGIVKATGNSKGAGIGGGEYGHATIMISGGNITARGGSSGGAGIGNGKDGKGSAIVLDYTDDTAETIKIDTGSYKGTVTLRKPFKNSDTSPDTFRETTSVSDLGKLAAHPPLVAWTDAEPATTEASVNSWTALQEAISDELTNEKRITLTGPVSAGSGNTRIEIPEGKNITIDLAGYTMDRGLSHAAAQDDGFVMHVAKNATLTIVDSSQGKPDTITGGTITGGHSTKCGGIFNEGTVYLKSGTITGNKSSFIGGGGSGGGIYNAGTLTISGGAISGNTADSWGGGIYLPENTGSTLNLNGGQITNNTCGNNGGGVHVSNTAYINASGSPVVKDNTSGSADNNVNLAESTFIRITGTLKSAAEINMHMSQPTSGTITSGLKGKGTAASFDSDDPDYVVATDGNGEAYLSIADSSSTTGIIVVSSWDELQAAANNARSGAIIKLNGPNGEVKRTGSQSRIQVKGNKRITIDLAGNKLNRNLTSKYDDGQVIEVFEDTTLTIRDSVGGGLITGGYAKRGGGICIDEGATCIITGGTITGNKATDDGGGIYVWGTLKMMGGAVTNNSAEDNGGGMFVAESGRIDLTGADISYNTAEDDGGGIKTYSKGDSRITDCRITYNKTNDKYGGGILMDMSGKTMTITDTKIDHNDADDDGGGIYLRSGTIVMSGGSLSENRSYRDGGGIRVIEKTTFNASDVTISKNTADTEEGGGIKNLGTSKLTNCTISNNKAKKEGGGIYNDDVSGTTGVLTLTDCTVFGNSTQKHGGGIYSSNKVTLIGGSITGNTANDCGGGVAAAPDATTYIGGSLVVKDNGAVTQGKDIYLILGRLIVTEPLVNPTASQTGSTTGESQTLEPQIGVTRVDGNGVMLWTVVNDNNSGVFTSGYDLKNHYDLPSKFFFSPEGYGVGRTDTGEAYFTSGWKELQDKIYTAADSTNGVVTLDTNYTALPTDKYLEIPKYKSVTINLAGHTLNRNRNSQDGDGHVIWVREDASLTLVDNTGTGDEPGTGTITGGYSKRGGGIYVDKNAALTATGINVTGNKADDDGGGIYVKDGGKLKMTNCVVARNEANDAGGGIFGGDDRAGRIDLQNVAVTDNYCSDDGGGMKLWLGADSLITNCVVARNSSDDHGGGMYIEAKGSTLEIRNTTIDNNSSSDDGAGIYLQTGTIVMSDSSISGNQTNNDSGGIKVTNKTEFHATNVEICNNTAKNEEAGALKNYGTTTLTNCTISGNTAGKDGGAIFNDKDGSGSNGEVTIENCQIFGNSTAGNGGGIYNDYKLTIKGVNLIGATPTEGSQEARPGNTAQNQGGGIYIDSGNDYTKLSGTLSMTGNSAGLGNDLYVRGHEEITLTGKITGTKIGMIDMQYPGVFTKDYSSYHSGVQPNTFFGTEPGAIPVEWNDKRTEAQLRSNWPDLQELINAAAAKQSKADKGHSETAQGLVKLDTNYTAGSRDVTLLVPKGKTVTIDLNGHSINRNLVKESIISDETADKLSFYDSTPPMSVGKDLGHVLKVEENATLTIKDSSATEGALGAGAITGGYARFGGGIFSDRNTTVNLEGGTILGNTATHHGGALYVQGALNMTGGALLANNALKSGGGICSGEASTLSIKKALIQSNSAADGNGGGLYMHSGTSVSSITGSMITNNVASEKGGALYFESKGKTVTITDTALDNNSSGEDGGGIYLYRGTIKMNGGSLSGNAAKDSAGGAMITSDTTFEATNVAINDNSTRNEQGGGVKNYGTTTLKNCSIIGNSSAKQGGGVFNDNDGGSAGKMTLENCTIQDNSSRGSGGGVYSDKKLNFVGGTITGNTTTERGGGVFIGGDSETTGIQGALVIKDNTASVFADDLYLRTGRKLELTGALLDAADIHTELQTGTGIVTKGYRSKNGSQDPETFFTFTKGYDVRFSNDGEVELTSGWNALKKKVESAESGTVIIIDKDYAAADSDDRIKIEKNKNITIDLNGYTLNRRRADKVNDGHVLEVFSGSTLTIKDGSAGQTGAIMGAWSNEGGIFVQGSATLNLQGGTVTGNRASSNGGGIFADGTVTMTGGVVEANKTSGSGGGICMIGGSTLNLEGGTVTGNEAGGKGGGIMINEGATANIKGAPVVEKNRSTDVGIDIYLPTASTMLNVTGALDEGAKLSVAKQDNGIFTSGYSMFNGSTDPAKYFISSEGHSVFLDYDEASLGFQVYGESEYTDPFIAWNDQVGSEDTLSSRNWMSGISGERYLNEINMPGSHDSGMNNIDNKKVSQVWTWLAAGLSLIATGIVAATAGAGVGLIISAGIFGASFVSSLAIPNDWTSGVSFAVEAISAPMAKTQKEYIDQQLNEGARQLDIRLYHKHKEYKFIGKDNFNGWQFYDDGKNLWVCHGKKAGGRYQAQDSSDDQLSFDMTLDWVMDFLEKHPTETIILDLRPETLDAGESRKIYERTRTILEARAMQINRSTGEPFLYKEPGSDDYFARYTHMPKMGDCRGKIVLMPEKEVYADYIGGFVRGDFVSESLDELYYQNSRSTMIEQARVEYGKANGDGSVVLPTDASQTIDRLWYWELNCTEQEAGFDYYIGLVDAPHKLAEEVNAALIGEGKTFGPERAGQYIGWVKMDSFEAKYAEQIWRTNFFEGLKYYTVTVKSGLDDSNYPDQTYRLLKGTEITIPGNIYKNVEDDLYFDCWTTDDEARHAPGTSFTVNEDVTFTANWLEKGKVPVQVVWKDGDNADDLRPSELPLTITMGSGMPSISLNLTADQDWRQVIELTGSAADISTTWVGVVPTEDYPMGQDQEGEYAYEWSLKPGTGYIVTFTHTPDKTISVSGDITWLDDDNAAKKRPTSVTVNLFKDGKQIEGSNGYREVSPDDKGSWTFNFGEKPLYENGEKVEYRITEDPITETVTKEEKPVEINLYDIQIDGFNITNTYDPDLNEMATVMGTMVWDDANNAKGLRPQRVDLTLKAGDEEVATQTVPVSESGIGVWAFEEVPLKDADGGQIEYTVVAENVEGYDVACTHIEQSEAAGISEQGSMSLGEETYLFQVAYTLKVPEADITPAGIDKVPEAREMTYSSEPQKLIEKGATSDGVLLYALGDSATTAPEDSEFSAQVPEGTDAGTYHVWYYVYGDALHNNTDPEHVDAEIEKAEQKVEAENVDGTAGDTDRKVEAHVTGVGDTDEGLGVLSFAVTESPEVASVNPVTGALTMNRVGTAKVGVTAAETKNYKAASTEVQVNVAPGMHTLTFYEDTEGEVVRKVFPLYDGMPLSLYASYGTAAQFAMTKPGYTFAGWANGAGINVDFYSDEDGNLNPALEGKLFNFETTITKDLDAYPIWIRDCLEVNLIAGDDEQTPVSWGTGFDGKKQSSHFYVDIDEKLHMDGLNSTTREGYDLDGWYTQGGVKWDEDGKWGVTPEYCDKDESGSPIINVDLQGRYKYYTVTLTAHWTPKKVGVEYVVLDEGGIRTIADGATCALGNVITLGWAPEAPEGMTFTSWKIDGDENLYSAGGQFTFKDWNLAKNDKLTFTAQYVNTPSSGVVVTFDSDGGTAVEPKVLADGAEINEAPATTKDGYTFLGWFNETASMDNPVGFPYKPNTSTTLKAHWQANKYTITFDSAGGTPIESITAAYESPINAYDGGTLISSFKPERLHYDFVDWYPALPDKMPLGGLDVVATWKPETYFIKFNIGDGSEPDAVEGIFGSTVDEPKMPAKDGFVFGGWLDMDGNPVTFPLYMPDTNPTYTAKWKTTQNAPPVFAEPVDAYSAKVPDALDGAEYVIMPAGQEPGVKDWALAKRAQDGQVVFENLAPDTSYDVWGRMFETDGAVQSAAAKATVRTHKATPIVTALPAAEDGLAYTGIPQALVTDGEVVGGTVVYAIGADDQTPPEDGWSADVPLATDAGSYFVWWKVVGDEQYEDLAPVCVPAQIAKADQNISIDGNAEGKVGETGHAIKASVLGVNCAAEGVGSLSFEVAEGADFVSVDAKTGELTLIAPGIAKVRVSAAATGNYNGAEALVTVVVTEDAPVEISYLNTQGDGVVWTKSSNVTVDFTFKRSVDDDTTFGHFAGVSVDGKAVDETNYTAESGSVIVKLKPDYLETLALGEHTLVAHFNDGNSGPAGFTIVEGTRPDGGDGDKTPADANDGGSATKATPAKGATSTPRTGDEGTAGFLFLLICTSAAVMLFVRRKTA